MSLQKPLSHQTTEMKMVTVTETEMLKQIASRQDNASNRNRRKH
jgi:hypothetical protein